MSIAAKRSHRGDEFQIQIAIHWLLRAIEQDSRIESVQVDAVAQLDDPEAVRVDDIIVRSSNSPIRFIQAKKNQQDHRSWSIFDLRSELRKARGQLDKYPDASIEFYSATPFGDLKKLAEESSYFPTLPAFEAQATASLKEPLNKLIAVLEGTSEVAFRLLRQLEFGQHLDLEQWEESNREHLRRLVSNAEVALDTLAGLVRRHQASLRGAPAVLRKDDVMRALEARNVFLAPDVGADKVAEIFARASAIGRSWLRTIANEHIDRPELGELLSLVKHPDTRSILLADGPGTGKTCILLDLADRLESQGACALLFIRGDEVATCGSPSALAEKGLPSDIVGMASRLAREQRLVVIIDSLDVLSLHREHGSLALLLNLMDRLQRIPNVVVVAACRAFDVQYDLQLRSRSWSKTLALRPLDFERTVRPLLERHGIATERWQLELRSLATNPQNLRLLTELGSSRLGAEAVDIRSPHQLHARYLEEVVAKNPLLGPPAISALEALAKRMIAGRLLRVPPVAAGADPSVLQRLVSQNVLLQTPHGALQFSHQTILDAVAVRGALATGQTLLEFILSLPPFPFVRPAVRSFVAHLRALQPEAFERQVRAAVESAEVAYHLKRTIVESFAEMPASSDDGPLLRYLWKSHPDLLRQWLARVERESWLAVLLEQWVPELSNSEQDRSLRLQFLFILERWLDAHPADVIRLWREALAQKSSLFQFAWRVSYAFERFSHWSAVGLPELVRALTDIDQDEHGFAGPLLSRYVEATGEGDNLLWEFVTRRLKLTDARVDLDKLRCEEHQFHRVGFLSDRFIKSDRLLDLSLKEIQAWSKAGEDAELLLSTSWGALHMQLTTGYRSKLSVLMGAVEEAMLSRARVGKPWWREREPSLRQEKSIALRYILLRAYQENPEEHLDGIAAQLLDRALLRSHDLKYEIGRVIHRSFPYLPDYIRDAHERLVLSLYADIEPTADGWAQRTRCELLLNIAASLRSRDVQDFLSQWAPGRTGPALPRVYSGAGCVSPPVSDDILGALSKASLWRLFEYYEHSPEGDWANYKGGLEELCFELAEAVSRAPSRYLALFADMWQEGIHSAVMAAVVRGVGLHLRYRHGTLQRPQNLKPDEEPLPDAHVVAQQLLTILESCLLLWQDPPTVADALQGLAEFTRDAGTAERIAWLLLQLRRVGLPNASAPKRRAQDLMFDALNAPAGVAARAGIILAVNLLEEGISIPPLLRWYLQSCASHQNAGIRAALLDHLPYVLRKDRGLAWSILSRVRPLWSAGILQCLRALGHQQGSHMGSPWGTYLLGRKIGATQGDPCAYESMCE